MAFAIAASISASRSARICSSVVIGASCFDAPLGQERWRTNVADVGETVKGFYPPMQNLGVDGAGES